MKNGKPISLRPVILGEAVSFLENEGMECLITQNGIVSLVNQLVNYREEGKDLFPKVYIVDDIDLVLQSLPMSQHCFIGQGEKTKETMLRALKKCAPLTEADWSIYIQRNGDNFSYGVFRAGTSLLSVSIEDFLIINGTEELKVILLHQISDKLIEIKGVQNEPLMISFGGREETNKSPIENQFEFIKTIVKNVDSSIKEQTSNFYKKVFNEILKVGHGTLACTINGSKKTIPKRLEDGIILKQRINIPEIIKELLEKDDLQANSKLNGFFTIIIGMMESDGITVFTDKGEVAAYNVFVKHPDSIAKTNTSGGARSRTFLTLCKLIGKGLESAYIQSQDGKIETKDNE
ncbi:hypothetical protein EV196_11310 [Mariniflexile fucanivorans]|uniref:Uncharacterized protein n=1 Tax=Mariniflexile fucanivorans TaxID=264023 RepID=A0A4R1RA29_9FLAO|nr:hypothetical protein [Mariniflexile fucanivorans]TCL62469.1 hypothetical protein EV196_11310 [Mariniflexile fucanivorans]